MKLRDDYPIYLNPTGQEIVEIAESRWDTLRVMESDDTIVIASGYGNTHETLVQYYKKMSGKGKTKERWDYRSQANEIVFVGKTPDWASLIFFHENTGIMLCNLGDVSGPDRAMPRRWKKEISKDHANLMCEIAELSGLRHDS